MKEYRIKTGENFCYYWLTGQGKETIVMTHGATMDHHMFSSQIEAFSAEHRLILWDVPAHGKSRPYRDFSLNQAVSDLIHILDEAGVECAHLIGQSMGGYITQLAGLDYPERVSSMVLLDSSPVKLGFFSVIDRWMLKNTALLLNLYPYKNLLKLTAESCVTDPQLQNNILQNLNKLGRKEFIDIMRQPYSALREIPLDQRAACPVLLLYGENDKAGKVISYNQRMAQTEGYPLTVIPAARHNANQDNPDFFNQTVLEWYEELGAKSR